MVDVIQTTQNMVVPLIDKTFECLFSCDKEPINETFLIESLGQSKKIDQLSQR